MTNFSAPGKAFLAGGYLVLDPRYPAFTTALSARIHAVSEHDTSLPDGMATVTVRSPQFKHGVWRYTLSRAAGSPVVDVTQVESPTSSPNPFVFYSVYTVLNYAQPGALTSLDITIYSDNAYHSQPTPPPGETLPRFNSHDCRITEANKTGLGSSAALTTVLTASLLAAYSTLSPTGDRMVLHNLSQIAHCAAQGKVGSGFDVACAVFGSIRYHRFPVEIISGLDFPNKNPGADPQAFVDALKHAVNDADWHIKITPSALPPKLRLMMGDITGGSETPKMVQTVLAWRKEHPAEAETLWESLNLANISLTNEIRSLTELARVNAELYAELMAPVAQLTAVEIAGPDFASPLKAGLVAVIESIKSIRFYLRELTAKTGAAIEPESQTALLDACTTLPGVLGGVVPGAGGYDAICVVAVEDAFESIVAATATDPRFKAIKWLDLHEEAAGLVEEGAEKYSL
ncbi:GHMP kinase N terminal domain-protein [Dipodascopsis tothii]|uniref:GHMP kinase N terminal domain-protein n=1 Tax=Dipodascopsis tothii TaxID=44089 RepID=UPI0034CEF6B1